MRNSFRSILPLLAFMLVSCAARGPLFQDAPTPKSNSALIYIYRPGSFVLGGRDAYFYFDNKNVADLSAEGYTQIYLNPGTYNIKQKWPIDLIGFKSLELPLTVEANKTYYYRFYSGGKAACPFGQICFEWSLQRVSEQDAKAEILKCHYQPAK